jgi:hypothetical protein
MQQQQQQQSQAPARYAADTARKVSEWLQLFVDQWFPNRAPRGWRADGLSAPNVATSGRSCNAETNWNEFWRWRLR